MPQPNRRPTLPFLLATLVLTAVFFLILHQIHNFLAAPKLQTADHAILEAIHHHATPTLTAAAEALSFIGSPRTLYIALPVLTILLWRRRLRHEAILLVITMAGSGIIESLIKLHYRRPRPAIAWAYVQERSFSFPSGHAVLAAALYGAITCLAWRHIPRPRHRAALCVASLFLIVAIGLSRLYLGAHYPSDVLSGYFIGSAWLLVVLTINRHLSRS